MSSQSTFNAEPITAESGRGDDSRQVLGARARVAWENPASSTHQFLCCSHLWARLAISRLSLIESSDIRMFSGELVFLPFPACMDMGKVGAREKPRLFGRFLFDFLHDYCASTSKTTSTTSYVQYNYSCASHAAVRTACGWGYGYGYGVLVLERWSGRSSLCILSITPEATSESATDKTMFLSIPGRLV